MTSAALKKKLVSALRLTLCVGAVWLCLRNVALHDSLVTRGAVTLYGHVVDLGETIRIDTAAARSEILPRSEIARDENGLERIAYGLSSIWGGSSKGWLLAGIAVFFVVPLLQAVRLSFVLRQHHIYIGQRESLRLALVGNFLNFAAPLGSTAGDVYKAWYVAQRTPRAAEAATLVFLDRILGLATLLLSVGLIAAFCPETSRLAPLRSYLLGLVGLLIGGCLIYGLPALRSGGIGRALRPWLPQHPGLARVDRTVRGLLSNPLLLIGGIGITLILQIFAALAFFCLAAAIGLRLDHAGWFDGYAYFSTGELIKAIPGPPQGLGTMELAYRYFFHGLGSASQIVSAALAIRLVNLICALPGACFLLSGVRITPRRAGAPPASRGLRPALARPV